MDTVDTWLGRLESEDLQLLERELDALTAMPGWAKLERLLQIRAMQSQTRLSMTVLEHAEYAREGGIIHGLMQPAKVINMVSEKARRVEDQLAAEALAERQQREEDRDV